MLIDSNVLIYALNTRSPKHQIAKNFLEKNQKHYVIALQNVFETIRIITHHNFPRQFTSSEAIEAVKAITSGAKIISTDLQTEKIAFELISRYKITGVEIFDTVLVATALSHGVGQIVTDNVKHLGRYEEIEVVGLG